MAWWLLERSLPGAPAPSKGQRLAQCWGVVAQSRARLSLVPFGSAAFSGCQTPAVPPAWLHQPRAGWHQASPSLASPSLVSPSLVSLSLVSPQGCG